MERAQEAAAAAAGAQCRTRGGGRGAGAGVPVAARSRATACGTCASQIVCKMAARPVRLANPIRANKCTTPTARQTTATRLCSCKSGAP